MEIYIIPSFFSGVDVAFEVIFSLICILIAIRSLTIYQISKQQESRLFGIGFLLMALSYICQLFFNVAAYSFSSLLGLILLFAHAILGLSALIVLAYTFSHSKSKTVLFALVSLMIVAVIFSLTILFQFYLLGAIFFGYIVLQCIFAYSKFKKARVLLTAFGFFLLLLAQLMGIFSFYNELCYMYSHLLSLGGYLVLFINLRLVQKR